jgi:hypothetical protein
MGNLKDEDKHYLYGTKENKAWNQMKQRCLNPNNPDYGYYGGRGITVCDRWKISFKNFIEDMGNSPTGTSLDREDVNGNYEPSNCKWSTFSEQAINRRIKETNTSGVTGVSFNKSKGKWVSYITLEGVTTYLGSFVDKSQAVDARVAAEDKRASLKANII